MERILIPVDGSKWSVRAVKHAIAWRAGGLELEVLLLNVQPGALPAVDRALRGAREGRSK